MGDRCFLTIGIGGTVETVEQLQAIIEALRCDYMHVLDCGDKDETYFGEFADALQEKRAPYFGDWEVNYASIDGTEVALQELGVPYAVSHEEGGDYGPGCWSWTPEHGEVRRDRFKGDAPAIGVHDLRTMLAQPNPLRLIREEIAFCDLSQGFGLPPFAVSDEVREFLSKYMEG